MLMSCYTVHSLMLKYYVNVGFIAVGFTVVNNSYKKGRLVFHAKFKQ